MSWEQVSDVTQYSPLCGAVSLAGKLHLLIKLATDNTAVLAAAASDKIVGVLREENTVGNPVTVQFGGVAKVIAGGSVAAGDLITSDGNGKGIATTSAGNRIIGIALEGANTNEVFPCALMPGSV